MKCFNRLILALALFPLISSAQNIALINSGEVMGRAATLYDSGKYKSALIELNKICRSDTNYVWSLYEKATNCEADSQYTQAVKYCREGLSLREQRDYEPDIYNTYGNTLNEMGHPDNAIKVFDSAIAKYPSFSLFYFNKGIVMMGLKKSAEAEALFQKTLMVNPYMYSAHFQLGLAALQQGKVIPAFLSFMGYLLMVPEGKYASRCINLLSQISKSTDEILDYKNKRTIMPDENYQSVEDIVLSKIALDPGYKPIIALDDPISRQMQAVFEKLEYSDANKDFWIQYYLPYYKQVYKDGKFELFINHIFSNVKVAVIEDYNKKNKKELESFVSDAGVYFDLIRSTRELEYAKRNTVSERYFFDSGKLIGKGTLANNGKILVGKWEALYSSGNLKNQGNYNDAGQREGEWAYYFFSGTLKAKEHLINGKLEGPQEYYFDNGNPSSHENYINNNADGLITTYFYAGNVKSAINYKAGKKDGEERTFYSNGNLKEVNNYAGGLLTGTSREYYKTGEIKSTEQYNNGKGEGEYKSYNENGSPSGEGLFAKDNAEGEWKYYDRNGKIKEIRNYINNIEEGVHQEYYDNGQLSGTYTARKGKINGEATYYYKDGKPFYSCLYDNGVARSVKYFDHAGAVLGTSERKGNSMGITTYTTDGVTRAHAHYNQKGDLEGADTLFYPSGKIEEINEYKDGDFNGLSVSYYLNGKKKSEVNMTDGKDDGYYTSFYNTGKLQTEGWIKDGDYQGEWRSYDESGRLSTISYYLDNDLDGYKEEYFPGGKKSVEQKYHLGWLEKMTQYDTTGRVLIVDTFPKMSGRYVLLHPNKKVMIQGDYVNGDLNGLYRTFYFDGSAESSGYYKRGLNDSTYVSYYYGGIKYVEGNYGQGNRIGTWKYYDEDGKLSNTNPYTLDQLNGEKIYYFPDGTRDYVGQYKDDQLDGVIKKYDPDGTLAYQVAFEGDNAKSYTYTGKDGKLAPSIPIPFINGSLKAYFPNGNLSRVCNYSDGVKNGPDIIYYSNGQRRSTDTTVYGATSGISREYFPNGKLKSEGNYIMDNLDGVYREYNDKGILKQEVTYENGEVHGPSKYHNENGKLVKTMWYYYGKLISVKNE